MDLPGDSLDYDLLYRAAVKADNVDGLFCEIGTRRGGSLKHIIEAITLTGTFRHIIAIDPYGNIDYTPGDHGVQKFDYTNDMKNEAWNNIYQYAQGKPVNIIFFNLEDTEFFNRFSTGVPVYQEVKQIINKYAFVFFDGPHDKESILTEVVWFLTRVDVGAVFVFDDVQAYDHDYIDTLLLKNNFERLETGVEGRKISYVKLDSTFTHM